MLFFFDAMRNSGGTTPQGGTYRNNVSKVGYYGTYTGDVAAEYTDTVINRLCSGSYYSRGDINTNVYAKIRPGDVLVTYTSGGLGHIMMVTGVELKYNGKHIDAEESKVYITDQNSPNVKVTSSYKSSWRTEHPVTFVKLKKICCLPLSLNSWKESYSVSYNANGGVNAPPTQSKAQYNDIRLSTKEPTREGYRFLGWKTSRNPITKEFAPGDYYTEERSETLYAIWEKANITEKEPISIATLNISSLSDAKYTGKAITPEVIVKDGTKTLKKGTDYTVKYTNNINVGKASVTITGIGNYTGNVTKYFNIVKDEPAISNADRLFGSNGTLRIYGKGRIETSMKSADALKKSLAIDKFNTVVIATGTNYPDALTGCYLAKVKNAPMLLVDKSTQTTVKNYLGKNMTKGGKVYLLGGTSVISSDFEKSLKSSGYSVERLSGKVRYDTNLAILKEANVSGEDLLICTGNDFADSLSASAAGKPILLVDKKLSKDQKEYLSGLKKDKKVYLIGGTGVVKDSFRTELKPYATKGITRVAGANRYTTSKAVADTFFKTSDNLVLAYAMNFPDGLSGGPLAMSLDAPLMLVDDKNYKHAVTYADKAGVKKVAVLGGTSLISDEVVNKIVQ